jgi:hypothetical protein
MDGPEEIVFMFLRPAWILVPTLLVPVAFATPTFHKDVQPILQRHCQSCHRPGEIGPMPLLTYSQARPFAAAIRETVRLKKMPPWGADPAHGKFANDPSLTPAEINTLSEWAAGKAPEGDPKDAPAPLTFVNGWNIPTPERVYEMPKLYEVPANGTIDYTYFVVPTGFTEDRWVSMAEVRPGDRSVVHHVIVFVREPGSPWLREAKPGEPYVPGPSNPARPSSGEYFVGYTPGKSAMRLEAGQAKLIRAGSDLVFQMHYTTNGKAAQDKTRVGLIFAKEPPKERVLTYAVRNWQFAIPPGEADYPVTSEVTFKGEARVVTYWPHMHVRGKSFRFEAISPDGKRETVLNVPQYDFNWQYRYLPSEPLRVREGSKLQCFATFDNSANNRFNPDPNATVRWGDQTWEEMMIGFIEIAFDAKKSAAEILPVAPRPVTVAAN